MIPVGSMTRRLTVGSRSEMGLLSEHTDPETPPPVWTPPKTDFWKRPSRWQVCLPRLRLVAKITMSILFTLFLLSIYYDKRPIAIEKVQTEEDLVEASKRESWLWKDFPRHDGLTRGTRHLKHACPNSQEDCDKDIPHMTRYDGYKSFEESVSDIVPCIGPRGLFMNESDEDAVWAYEGIAKGAVDPVIGSYGASGLDGSVSFDRVGRFQAYGLDQYDAVDISELKTSSDVDWNEVRWGDLQDACVDLNRARFKPLKERQQSSIQYSNIRHKHGRPAGGEEIAAPAPGKVNKTKRTAILIRVWTGAIWSADAVINLRAMIAEASLASGGKYQVFILLHVKDEAVPLFVGEDEPMNTIRKNVPPEFHSITEVWNHAQIRSLYSNLAEHAFVGRSPWMIVQWFSRNHPEFDFFYQWEFDVRYTGHYLDFFESITSFAKKQPRKGIWERAGRVYIPSFHGDFETQFRTHVHNEDPHHVWGPVSVEGVKPRGPKPPTQAADDQFEWGVGEDADWVGFLPSFNVTETHWWFKDYLWGYAQGASTPRRATLIAQGRVSRRLLEIMNYENAENGHLIDAEMFPQTMCLHHSLKSTTFPHPIFSDREWPAASLQQVFNPGPFGQAGGVLESTFSKWNEFAWTNMTWYFNSAQAKPVYQQLLGITARDKGGSEWEEAYGRAVVRPMLLHPVKGAKSTQWTKDGWTETKGGK